VRTSRRSPRRRRSRGSPGSRRSVARTPAGRVYDIATRRFVSPDEAVARAAGADLVLLGEKHDNPDHHRLQAWLLDALARAGRRPAVVFEMIPRDRAGALATALGASPSDPDALAEALDWSHSGWPPFALYRPVFEVALAEDAADRGWRLLARGTSALRNGGWPDSSLRATPGARASAVRGGCRARRRGSRGAP
jgi:hypothetical protein